MSRVISASPQISVRLYKTISRKTIDGQSAVSARYQGKSEFIDLTPFLGDTSSVRTSKSVREPAGAFSITFADQARQTIGGVSLGLSTLETIYGLVEPMDIVEIRMWRGTGRKPAVLPIKMRGIVTEVQRQQGMGDDGKPQRQVVITGQDYGKIWQMFQILYLAAYGDGKALLTNFALFELFGVGFANAMPAGDFIRDVVKKVINPHIAGFMPKNTPMPKEIKTGDSIAVKHGVVNISNQNLQGSLYDIMKLHGNVGVWNELYTEDREDGVHCVYRPIPALLLSAPKDSKSREIQDDAPDPVYVSIHEWEVAGISVARSNANVANFFWVTNSRFDLIDDQQRKLASIPANDGRVMLKDYQNADPKLYGLRPMFAETQQGGDGVDNMTSGQDKEKQGKRATLQESWLDRRRRQMMEMNKDNVVYERGTARVKGCPMRADGKECMKAGDYALFRFGKITAEAYVVQIDDEFSPFQSYTTTLTFERGTGFAARASMESGTQSPWLAEQSSMGMP